MDESERIEFCMFLFPWNISLVSLFSEESSEEEEDLDTHVVQEHSVELLCSVS